MTTNQTIDGVPGLRELLERVATEANHMLGFTYASNYDDCRTAVDELRALLDAPAVESELSRMTRRCQNAELALKVQTENYEALKAAHPQGEIETLRAALRTEVDAGDSWKREALELREKLESQPQGEPVFMKPQYLSVPGLWIECKEGEIHAKPFYTEQRAPVAMKYDDTLLPFVAMMRKELHANAGKGDRPGWLSMTTDTCLLEIIYHFGKLQASVKRGDEDGIREYAADVANMCMMLSDICNLLETK